MNKTDVEKILDEISYPDCATFEDVAEAFITKKQEEGNMVKQKMQAINNHNPAHIFCGCRTCGNALYSEHDPSNGHKCHPDVKCIFRIRKDRIRTAAIEQAQMNHDICPFYRYSLTDEEYKEKNKGLKNPLGAKYPILSSTKPVLPTAKHIYHNIFSPQKNCEVKKT